MAPSATSATATTTSNAENILRLVPEVDTHLAASPRTTDFPHDDLQGYDEEQVRLMEEVCIVIDEEDNPIGSGSKKLCHSNSNIEKGLLHRAFSVFLFDSKNRLLMQQRASEKITFPDMWTNTCCSHPLGVPSETGNTLPQSIAGAKNAAQRKLNHELGIPVSEIPLEKFDFLTRIHYKAASDGKWGEHEIDYILVIQPEKDVTLEINPNEVRDIRYVMPNELKSMIAKARGEETVANGAPSTENDLDNGDSAKPMLTPWFGLICETLLFQWWDKLDDPLAMKKFKGETDIRRMV